MQEHDTSWVRTEMVLAQAPPRSEAGSAAWVRKNLFATPADSIITVVALLFVAWLLPQILGWTIFNAQWTGADRTACLTVDQGGYLPSGWSGACWAFVTAKFPQFMFGRYPLEERWRVILTAVIFIALLAPLLIPRAPYKRLNAILFFGVFPFICFFLLVGGFFGLRYVETSEWGGLLVTLVLSYVGIVVSLPLGVLLALGRRSRMPAIKLLSVIFAAAYMAEVVRGGLQAIPKGQYEGADSLGLGYWQKTRLIIMPQALKLVIPGIVNTFIGMFKDTTLVLIISMFDLLGIVKQNLSDANWATPQTAKTGLVFAAIVFWLFCFGMSRYSIYMERRLDTGHKR